MKGLTPHMSSIEKALPALVWTAYAVITLGSIAFRYSFDSGLTPLPNLALHIVWMFLLHYMIVTLVWKPKAPAYAKVIFIVQMLVPLVLSLFMPKMHMVTVLSLGWLVLIQVKLLMDDDKWRQLFDWLLIAYLFFAFVGVILHREVYSAVLREFLYGEFIATIFTFALAFWVFRLYIYELRKDMYLYREEAWYHEWYYTLMKHLGHNLRTPASQISSNLELMRMQQERENKMNPALNRALSGSGRLKQMLDSVVISSSINNLSQNGDTVEDVLLNFLAKSTHPVKLEVREPFLERIKGPEIISLVMALDAFVDNSWRYGASKVILEMNEGGIRLKDNGPGLPDYVRENIGKAHLGESTSETYGLSIHFMFQLLKESGWTIVVEEWKKGVTYKISRIHSNWSKRALN